jgi:Uncharacterized membrane protein (homolog of Drosophila rhomboid)
MSLTLIIVILTSLISYNCFQDRGRFENLLHSPYQEKKTNQYYRLLTSGFLHGSMGHLLINMFVLYMFGEFTEFQFLAIFGEVKGRLYFLLLYLLTIVFANIPTFLLHKNNPHFSSVGASGGVSGLVFVYILFLPWEVLYLFLIIPCPAIIAGILYLAYSSWAAKKGTDRIDHVAHFGGAIFGFLFTIALKPEIFQHFLFSLQTNAPFFN